MDHAERVMRIYFETERLLADVLGDTPKYRRWEDVPEARRRLELAVTRFALVNPDASDRALHEHWCRCMRADGWSYGREFSEPLKKDPHLVSYGRLIKAARLALAYFRTITRLEAAALAQPPQVSHAPEA